MLLSIRDRFTILNILPAEGDFSTIKIAHELRQNLAPSESEVKDYKIKIEAGQVLWDDIKERKRGSFNIEIGAKAHTIIQEQFEKLNEAKKLREGHLSTYEKFFKKE